MSGPYSSDIVFMLCFPGPSPDPFIPGPTSDDDSDLEGSICPTMDVAKEQDDDCTATNNSDDETCTTGDLLIDPHVSLSHSSKDDAVDICENRSVCSSTDHNNNNAEQQPVSDSGDSDNEPNSATAAGGDSDSDDAESVVDSSDNVSNVSQVESNGTRPTESTEQGSHSEDGRKRDNTEVLKKYPQFVLSSAGFLCRTCLAFASPGDKANKNLQPFISTGSFLGDHPDRRLNVHLNSKLHGRCVENEKMVKEMLSKGGLAGLYEKRTKSEIESNRQYFSHLIKSLNYHIQHYTAKSQIPDFIKFVASLGDEVTERFLSKNSGSAYGTYLSPVSIDEILTSYSIWCSEKIADSLSHAEVATYYSDDSESHNDSDEMVSFLTWIDPSCTLGTLQPYAFMNIRSVAPEAEAATDPGVRSHFGAHQLYSSMKTVLEDLNIEQKLVKFICFDGTNTMSGPQGGVQKLWRDDYKDVVYINCRNHRLALVFVHLKRIYPLVNEFDQLLIDMYLAIDFSKTAKVVFHHIQAISGEDPLKMLKACTTRWLTHFKAITRVLERYDDLLTTFDTLYLKTKDTKYLNINVRASDPEKVCLLVVMEQVLQETNPLSLCLQSTTANITKILDLVGMATHHVDAIPDSEICKARCQQFLQKAKSYRDDSVGFRRQTRRGDDQRAENFDYDQFKEDFLRPFCKNMSAELSTAFYDDQHPVVNSLIQLFVTPVHQSSSTTSTNELTGTKVEKHLKDISDHYSLDAMVVEQDQNRKTPPLVDEYNRFTRHLGLMKMRHESEIDAQIGHVSKGLQSKKTERAKNARKVPQYVIKNLEENLNNLKLERHLTLLRVLQWMTDDDLKDSYPNIWFLLSVCSIMPLSNALSERGFSVMNLLCTKNQGAMKTETLDKLMMIKLFPQLALTNEAIEGIIDIFNTRFNKKRHIPL